MNRIYIKSSAAQRFVVHWIPRLLAVGFMASAAGAVNIETVPVGNPGNAPDTRYATPGFGAVDYVYNIGKYEITAGQYTEFLNAVAKTDTYGLYNPAMDYYANTIHKGCNIRRSGSPGSYTYSVWTDWADRPVNYVSWGDAARFCNWLHNGQPTGAQDLTTTEDGAYYLNGAMTHAVLLTVTRKPDARWAITSEDEWYKAAFHKNDGVTSNYWDYPTRNDIEPSNLFVEPDPGNNATFYVGGYTIGSPYYRTEVGVHEDSGSPYGTFDQAGNVWEWNEAVINSYRGMRGGGFENWSGSTLHAADRYDVDPFEFRELGFRVVSLGSSVRNITQPMDYWTIQEAINAASPGDEIVVSPGIYRESINFNGKDIVLRSTDPGDWTVVASTVIDGDIDQDPATADGPTVTFENGETRAAILTGFTITGGTGKSHTWRPAGGGIYCVSASPTIRRNVIEGNVTDMGGGAYFSASNALVEANIIRSNQASHSGGGLKTYAATAVIRSNIVSGNVITGQTVNPCCGGGIDCYSEPAGSASSLLHNTFVGNRSTGKGGGVSLSDASPLVRNNIIADNIGDAGLYAEDTSAPDICYNNIWNNVGGIYGGTASTFACASGEIFEDPLFVAAGAWNENGTPSDPWDDVWIEGDYHLQEGSPCVNAGDPAYVAEPGETDIDGDYRAQCVVEIGADETSYATNALAITNTVTGMAYCSLQPAIDEASEGDEIVLAPGTYRGPGNRDIDFKGKAITVRGTDPADPTVVAATVIDCEGTAADPHRGFKFHSGETSSSVLSGLTVTNGYAPQEDIGGEMRSAGGAIFLNGSSPTISYCVITGNQAAKGADGTAQHLDGKPGGHGGGICCINADLKLANCEIVGNAAGDGGMGMTASYPARAGAGGAGGSGGGVYSNSEIVLLTNTVVSGNEAGDGGSGGDGDDAPAGAGGIGGSGGGIDCSGELHVTDCVIASNMAGNGGSNGDSIYYWGYAPGQGGHGGGIRSLGAVTLFNTEILHNTTGEPGLVEAPWSPGADAGHGGGICSFSAVQIIDSTISGNQTADGRLAYESAGNGGNGGGVYCTVGEIRGSVIRNNSTGVGGADWDSIYQAGNGGDGGGVHATGDLVLHTSSFSGNATGNGGWGLVGHGGDGGSGAGVYCAGSLSAHNCIVSENQGGDGGSGTSMSTQDGGRGGSGAGFYAIGSMTISNCTINENVAGSGGEGGGRGGEGGDGGGLYCGSSAMIVDSEFIDNQAGSGAQGEGGGNGGQGGAVSCFGDLTIEGSTVSGNQSGRGGDLSFETGGKGGDGGGFYVTGSISFTQTVIVENTCGVGGQKNDGTQQAMDGQGPGVYVDGDSLEALTSTLEGVGGLTTGDGIVNLDPDKYLSVGDALTLSQTSQATGSGMLTVEQPALLTLADSATIDFERDEWDSCATATTSLLQIDGELLAKDTSAIRGANVRISGLLTLQDSAALEESSVCVYEAEVEGANQIQNNILMFPQATAGFGGRVFVQDLASVMHNRLISEGDRYLDLDPDAENQNLNITDNQIEVLIKPAVPVQQGTLLELRTLDHDHFCDPLQPQTCVGAFPLASSLGFADTWTLERLEITSQWDLDEQAWQGARLNLTNRPGFQFQTDTTHPEAIYVKDLILHPEAVLNTAYQRLYYEKLWLGDGSDTQANWTLWAEGPPYPDPLPNGSRIVNVPLLGFSLATVAMNDDVEFNHRVRTRVIDPEDEQPCECLGNCNPGDPNEVPDPDACLDLVGEVARLEGIPEPGQGVMRMQTYDGSSVAAKGHFARAGDEDITITFDYLFQAAPPGTTINIYLSDDPRIGERIFKVAELRPPPAGFVGSTDGDRFGTFFGRFPRVTPRYELNFTRGTYVELELEGPHSEVWIDNFDPQVWCGSDLCGVFDYRGEVTEDDYLLLLSESGRRTPLGKFCLDMTDDGYINQWDLLTWDLIFNETVDLCQRAAYGACCLPDGDCVEDLESRCLDAGGVYQGDWTSCELISCEPFPASASAAPLSGASPSIIPVLKLLGKDVDQIDRLYGVDAFGQSDDSTGTGLNCPSGKNCDRGAVRLIRRPDDTLAVVHAAWGLLADDGTQLLTPTTKVNQPSAGYTVTVGYDLVNEVGIPLADAAFLPSDPDRVVVIPVEVTPPNQCHIYRAAALLHLTGNGDFTVEAIIGSDPYDPTDPCYNCTPECGEGGMCKPACDLSGLREVAFDAAGLRVFAAGGSKHGVNDNDWVVVYDAVSGNELSRTHLATLMEGAAFPVPESPGALHLSSRDPTKLYLAASVDESGGLLTRVYRFTIDGSSNLSWDGVVEIDAEPQAMPDTSFCASTSPLCQSGNDFCDPESGGTALCVGFTAGIMAIQEAASGALYVVGTAAVRFDDDTSLDPSVTQIFTTPTLAQIPLSTTWSTTPSSTSKINAMPIHGSNLALPLTAVMLPVPLPMDFDGDGDVDADDVDAFTTCASGPMIPVTPGCEDKDLDNDGDVDQIDFAILQRCISGPGVPANPNCINIAPTGQ